jgi:hypothetical protein
VAALRKLIAHNDHDDMLAVTEGVNPARIQPRAAEAATAADLEETLDKGQV